MSTLAKTCDGLARASAALAAALMLFYPVRAFLLLPELPLPVRICWPLAALLAAWRPRVAALAFLIGAPLLPLVPSLLAWPRASLPELWLLALLVPACVRVAVGQRGWRAGTPAGVPLYLTVAAASLVVTLFPLHLSMDGGGALVRAVHEFLRIDFVVSTSQRHLYSPIVAWATVAEGLALLWLILSERTGDDRRTAVEMAMCSAAGASLVALHGVAQRWTRRNLLEYWMQVDPAITRINATFSDVNGLGAYLAMALWIIVAVALLRRDRWWRAVWLMAAGTAAASIVFTASRTAWAAAVAGGALFAVARLTTGPPRPAPRASVHGVRWVAAAAVGAMLTLGALTAYATARDVRHADQRTYFHTLLYTLNLKTPVEDRLKGRLTLWEAAVRMVARRPVFGIGLDNYYKKLWAYAPRQDMLAVPQENAHNYFLQIAAELGLVGLAAFLAILIAAVAAARRAARAADPATRTLAIGSGAGIVTFALASITGHPLLLREGQFVFWPVVACALLLGRVAHEAAATPPVVAVGARGAGTGGRARVAVLAGCVAIAALVPIRAQREARTVKLGDLAFGLYDVEKGRDGTAYRWSTDRVIAFVPSSARTFTVPIRSFAPFAQTVSIVLNGQRVDEIVLNDHEWRRPRYLMPARRAAPPFYRLEVLVTPPWRPAWEARTLGVMMGEIESQK